MLRPVVSFEKLWRYVGLSVPGILSAALRGGLGGGGGGKTNNKIPCLCDMCIPEEAALSRIWQEAVYQTKKISWLKGSRLEKALSVDRLVFDGSR